MTLQQFIHFDQYVRCFTFGKNDIVPVAYDPHQRRYLVEHEYLSAGARRAHRQDAQTLNNALGYEMNTIEFAVRGRRAVRDRLPEPGARLRARSHHAVLLRHGRAEDGRPGRSIARCTASRSRRGRAGRRCWSSANATPIGVMTVDPIDHWHALLAQEPAGAMCARLTERMRERRLRFGDRVHLPVPPAVLPRRRRRAARARASPRRCGRWASASHEAAMDSPAILRQLALSDDEIRLARIDPGYATTSTAARADAFILPDSLQFAEYNGESPAGAGYSQGLAELFSEEAGDGSASASGSTRGCTGRSRRCSRRCVASYREWGGTASPPRMAIVDWREVPTCSEFEILRDAFTALGVPTVVCDPRDLESRAGERRRRASARPGSTRTASASISSTAACSSTTSSRARTSAARCSTPTRRAPCCVANSLRCKIPHKKAFFAVLTDERHAALFSAEERELIRRHIPWTAIVEDGPVVARRQDDRPARAPARATASSSSSSRTTSTAAPASRSAGKRARRHGTRRSTRAVAERDRGWVAQERIAVRRELFPVCEDGGVVDARHAGRFRAVPLPRPARRVS